MTFAITDLSDAHDAQLRYPNPVFNDYGGRACFYGPVITLRAFEDNSLVREAVEQAGDGHVLVVDGGGSMNCALFGGNLATLAANNGWAGVVIYGCVRDTEELAAANVGIKALAVHPRKSEKRGRGTRDIPVHFAGVSVAPGDWLYADRDGIIIAAQDLNLA
jgi:regulator of ribonuclease activity A